MKIRDLDLSASPINLQHQAVGLPPVEDLVSHPDNHPVLRMVNGCSSSLNWGNCRS